MKSMGTCIGIQIQNQIDATSSRLPGGGRSDHGDPIGVVGLEDAGDGDVEECLVGERRPAGADVDGQVGARVPARVQLPPVHRPELRLPRVALVQHRLDRRQRRGAQAEESERDAGGRETHCGNSRGTRPLAIRQAGSARGRAVTVTPVTRTNKDLAASSCERRLSTRLRS
jgi:hypothetical protein